MWVDERRTVHTVEADHWTRVVDLSPASRAALEAAPAVGLQDLLDDVEEDTLSWWEAHVVDPVEEASFARRLPPRITVGLVGPPLATIDVLGAQLRRQSARWRLDYVWALRDCLADRMLPAHRDASNLRLRLLPARNPGAAER
jgi:hypothetical protein